ncbi:MAG: hypothetical protein ABIG20_02850, partial [archaeon]
MQKIWKKAGAALSVGLMIGATMAGAAFAEETEDVAAMDLGDYQDLMVSSDGTVTGLYVVGENAAAADVIAAVDMAGATMNIQVSGDEAGEGEITLTPLTTDAAGVTRHIQLDKDATYAYEFGGSTAVTTDVIGPAGYASGDGVVDYLYSHKEKGYTYIDGLEKTWHEEVEITLSGLNASRDMLDTQTADQYDEVFLKVSGSTIKYYY